MTVVNKLIVMEDFSDNGISSIIIVSHDTLHRQMDEWVCEERRIR